MELGTNDKSLMSDPEYQKVIALVKHLWDSGMVRRGFQHCYSMSDIIQKLLNHYGIESYLEECYLMILKKNPPEIRLVGYEQNSDDVITDKVGEVQTHVVCITKTKYPLLIDLSISEYIEDVPYICQRINPDQNKINIKNLNNVVELGNFEFDQAYFKYSKKSNTQLPSIHQTSIINRIETDKKIFNSIKRINIIVSFIIVISSLNLIRGTYDHYQKYVIKDNGFGPNKIHYQIQKEN